MKIMCQEYFDAVVRYAESIGHPTHSFQTALCGRLARSCRRTGLSWLAGLFLLLYAGKNQWMDPSHLKTMKTKVWNYAPDWDDCVVQTKRAY